MEQSPPAQPWWQEHFSVDGLVQYPCPLHALGQPPPNLTDTTGASAFVPATVITTKVQQKKTTRKLRKGATALQIILLRRLPRRVPNDPSNPFWVEPGLTLPHHEPMVVLYWTALGGWKKRSRCRSWEISCSPNSWLSTLTVIPYPMVVKVSYVSPPSVSKDRRKNVNEDTSNVRLCWFYGSQRCCARFLLDIPAQSCAQNHSLLRGEPVLRERKNASQVYSATSHSGPLRSLRHIKVPGLHCIGQSYLKKERTWQSREPPARYAAEKVFVLLAFLSKSRPYNDPKAKQSSCQSWLHKVLNW